MENRRKNLSLQLAHFEETTKNFLCSTATSRKKKQQQQKTNKQTKKHPTEATRPFLHPSFNMVA